MRIHNKVIAACISIVVWLLATSAAADSPTAQIKSTVDQVIKLLTDPRLSGENKNTNGIVFSEIPFFPNSILKKCLGALSDQTGAA